MTTNLVALNNRNEFSQFWRLRSSISASQSLNQGVGRAGLPPEALVENLLPASSSCSWPRVGLDLWPQKQTPRQRFDAGSLLGWWFQKALVREWGIETKGANKNVLLRRMPLWATEAPSCNDYGPSVTGCPLQEAWAPQHICTAPASWRPEKALSKEWRELAFGSHRAGTHWREYGGATGRTWRQL